MNRRSWDFVSGQWEKGEGGGYSFQLQNRLTVKKTKKKRIDVVI